MAVTCAERADLLDDLTARSGGLTAGLVELANRAQSNRARLQRHASRLGRNRQALLAAIRALSAAGAGALRRLPDHRVTDAGRGGGGAAAAEAAAGGEQGASATILSLRGVCNELLGSEGGGESRALGELLDTVRDLLAARDR